MVQFFDLLDSWNFPEFFLLCLLFLACRDNFLFIFFPESQRTLRYIFLRKLLNSWWKSAQSSSIAARIMLRKLNLSWIGKENVFKIFQFETERSDHSPDGYTPPKIDRFSIPYAFKYRIEKLNGEDGKAPLLSTHNIIHIKYLNVYKLLQLNTKYSIRTYSKFPPNLKFCAWLLK